MITEKTSETSGNQVCLRQRIVFLLLELDIFNDLRTVNNRADESWSVVTARQSIKAILLGVTFQGHFTLLISVFVGYHSMCW